MAQSRVTAALEAWSLERSAVAARLRELDALARAGARVFEKLRSEDLSRVPEEKSLACCLRLARLDEIVVGLESALDRSLAKDRADYAQVAEPLRWIVIARGICDRVVMRARRKHALRERPAIEEALGRVAVDGTDEVLRALVPAEILREVDGERAHARDARERAAALLRPYDGKLAPDWMATVAREITVFGRMLGDQLKRKIVQRPPAIAGLIAGWWVAHAFTDSWLEGQLHAVGLGGKSYLAPETKERLAFWLPLVAAALCSYVALRIDERVRRRYAVGEATTEPDATVNATAVEGSTRR